MDVPNLPAKLTVSVFANPLYLGVAVFVITVLLLMWKVPTNRPVSIRKRQHVVTALIVASVATMLSHMSHTGHSINEVFDTNPAGF
jgi:Mn2+/Fe2+ NRAMP family transporter